MALVIVSWNDFPLPPGGPNDKRSLHIVILNGVHIIKYIDQRTSCGSLYFQESSSRKRGRELVETRNILNHFSRE